MSVRFEEVVEEYGPALWRLTAGWASFRAEREDLYQEILLALWRALPRFRGESQLRTYVFRIAHNRCLSQIGRRQRERTHDREEPPAIVDPAPGPERQAADRERLEQLRKALRRLALPRRQVLLLHLEGLSQREIGDVLGITENNVAVRLHRARAALRDIPGTMERPLRPPEAQ